MNTNNMNKINNIKKEEKNRITKSSNTIISLGPLNFHQEGLTNIEKPVFEMFGITLYIDDIIILCILFFLYKEGIKDDLLYISLLLILVT